MDAEPSWAWWKCVLDALCQRVCFEPGTVNRTDWCRIHASVPRRRDMTRLSHS
jgi:hypothetical protein